MKETIDTEFLWTIVGILAVCLIFTLVAMAVVIISKKPVSSVGDKTVSVESCNTVYTVTKVTYESHCYLLFSYGSSGAASIIHDPICNCTAKPEE